jgi:putative ABC transport system ATP-binding protein
MGARIGREQSQPDVSVPGREPAQKTFLEARGIVHVYGEGARARRALQGVSLALKGGELTLLMGPSGSGKTTLLSILGCILTPSEGVVYLGGQAATRMPAEQLACFRRRHIGYVFQSYNLFPTLTAEENVRIALDVRGLKGSDSVIASQKALQTVGLLHKAKSFPGTLSGGEQQRVAVARALVGAPSVILADEPTAALDSKNGMGVMELLKQIVTEPSCAILAVTHDPRTVPFADRILHIEDGMIVNEQKRSDGVATVNDISLARNQRMAFRDCATSPLKFPTINRERERRLEIIEVHLRKYAPGSEPPFTLSDVVKARLAQRARDDSKHHCTAREDVLLIVAEWDNPDDTLASQSDACLISLGEMFEG